MSTDEPEGAVIITLRNAAGEVTERHVITAKAEDGHPECGVRIATSERAVRTRLF